MPQHSSEEQASTPTHMPFDVLNTVPTPSIIIDKAHTIRFANNAFLALLGTDESAILQENFADLLSPSVRESALAWLDQHLSAYQHVLVLHYTNTSHTLQASVSAPIEGSAYRLLHFQSMNETPSDDLPFKAMIEQSPAGVILTDVDGYIVYTNPALAALSGYQPQELIGQHTRLFRTEYTPHTVYEELWQKISQGHTWNGYFCNRKKSGDVYWEAATISPIHDEAGRTQYYIAIKSDVSNTYQQGQKSEIGEQALQALLKHLPLAVMHINHQGKIIHVFGDYAAIFGVEREIIGQHFNQIFPHLETAWQRARYGQHIHHQERNTQLPQHINYTLFPINGGTMLIAFDITNQTQARIEAEQQEAFTQALVNSIAAINASLDLETVTQSILDNIEIVVPFDTANMMLIDERQAMIVSSKNHPEPEKLSEVSISLDNPILSTMIEEKHPLVIANPLGKAGWDELPSSRWAKSYIGVPIRVDELVFGFINLASFQANFYTVQHAQLLQAFTQQAAIAIRNSRVHQHLRNYAQEIATLDQLNAALVTTIHPTIEVQNIAQEIVSSIVRALGKVNCTLQLLDRESKKVHSIAHQGRVVRFDNSDLQAQHDQLIAETIDSLKAIYIADMATDERYRAYVQEDSGSELIIPLTTSSGVIGVLDLQSNQSNAFSGQKRRALHAFSVRAATAIENTMLYAEIRRFAAEQEQKVIERTRELNRSREQIEAILNSSGDAIIFAKPDGRIRQTNPAFDALFGYKEDELFGEQLARLFDYQHLSALTHQLEQVVADQEVRRFEVTALRKDGTEFDADVTLSAVLEYDDVRGIVVTARDISHQKRIESSLRTALMKERELGDLKSRFVSITSHEFRTPLASILSSSDLLQNYRSRMSEKEIALQLENIESQVQHMEQLMEDVLTIGKADTGNIEINIQQLNLHSLCTSIIQDIKRNYGEEYPIRFSSNCQEALIGADKRLLRQIITNLLSNAIKYSPLGSAVELDLICEKRRVMIRVQDYGVGIPAEDQPHIFNPFHRATNVGDIKGTGLGLSIVKYAVEAHGGQIEFESNVNIGTTFIISLPRLTFSEENTWTLS